MSEETSPSPDQPKPKRELKIGSQRPGYVPDTPKSREPQMPAVPKKEKPKQRVTPAPIATPADPSPVPSPTEQAPSTAAAAEVSETAVVAEAEETKAGTVESAAPAKPDGDAAVATDAASDAVSAAIVEKVAVASVPDISDINLDMSDEELELEIASAMGADVEQLMAGQVQPATEDEAKIDGRYTAKVLKIFRESVLFDLPGPHNGAIPLRYFKEQPEPGTELEVVVIGFSAEEQLYDCLVPGGSVEVLDWSDVQEGVVVEATITGHNKGGLECEVNKIRGFIPASQVSLFRVEDFEQFVGQKMSCVVTEAKPEKRNLVLSHRAVLEREREEAREKLLEELAVGQKREGTVTRLQKFGAFVDLGGIDGLIHISQLSWDNIRHPSEVVAEGQQVTVRIETLDKETGKIGLSYRDLSHHPWEGIDAKYPINSVVAGTVSKLMDFGAFVKLEPGVEGLVHISELSHKRVTKVHHVVNPGDRVEVKVLSVDAEAQRISLSIKATQAGGGTDSEAEDDEPIVKHVPKTPVKMLKGGTGSKKSDGDKFGLKW